MTKTGNGQGNVSLRKGEASNDNQGASYQTPVERCVTRKDACLRVMTDLPERLPVIDGEAALIESYLCDWIAEIIANDNFEL